MDAGREAISLDITNAAKLRAGVLWRCQRRVGVLHNSERCADETCDADFDVRQEGFIRLARPVPPIRQDCDSRELLLEAGCGESTHQRREGMCMFCQRGEPPGAVP